MYPTFQLELVTPEKLLIGKQVVLVTVPGGEGDYGVLAGHAATLTNLRPGVISIYEQNDRTITESLFVAGGFAEVTADRCTVLAEEVTPVAELDRAAIETELKTVREELPAARTDTERSSLEFRQSVAEAKLQAIAA